MKNQKQLSPTKCRIMHILFQIFPFGIFHPLRCSLLRWAGATVGKGVRIMPEARFVGRYTLIIGDNCFIGHDTILMGSKNSVIELEDNVTLSSRVTMSTGTHLFSAEGDKVVKDGCSKDIRFCKGSGVLMGSVVLPGVTIERMALVAAGSTVVKDVPAYHLVGGCPAKIIRDMRDEKINS